MATHTERPGVIHLTGSGAEVRCLDVSPAPADWEPGRRRVGGLCGLAYGADAVAGDVAPGQLDAGQQVFTWDDIEWIHLSNPLAEQSGQPAGGRGDGCAE